ncbi:MAG: PaaI family thioesterase [Ideonella sp.]|nr:PaaI family thioesterase [Ideonella sp.]MCC7459104.1 PaaI family thioesterase [Nitrospira sp.]
MSTPAALSRSDEPTDAPQGFTVLPIGGHYMAANGPLYARVVDGRVQLGFRVQQRHTNPLNICHGGMLASFADMLLPVCTQRQSDIGRRFLPTISLQLDYLAPVPLGAWVQGDAEVLRVTRKMVFAQGVARVDGEPVLRVSGLLKIGQPFDRALDVAA